MSTATLLNLLRRRPYQPFTLRMRDGETHQIAAPNAALLLKSTVIVGSAASDHFAFCSLAEIAEAEILDPPNDDA